MVEGGYYWWSVKGKAPLSLLPSPKISTGEYVVIKKIDAFHSPSSDAQVGYFLPGRYFTVLEQKDSWLKIKTTRYETSWEGWIKASSNDYKPVEK